MRRLLPLLFLLFAVTVNAAPPQHLFFPGPVSGASSTGCNCGNLTAGPGSISITGNGINGTDQISNVNVNGVLNVKTFGAIGDGNADDTAALQKAINAGIAQNKCTYLPAGNYKVTNDLNLASPGPTINHPCLYGDSPVLTSIQCNDPGGNCIDLTGSDAYYLANFGVYTGSQATAPNVLILSARGQYNNAAMADGFGYEMKSVWTGTAYPGTKYTWYNYGAEIGMVDNCRFGTDGNFGTQVVISATNTANIHSKYATVVSPVPPVSPYWNTSMSVVNFNGGVIAVSTTAGQPQNCGVMFDNQLPAGAPSSTFIGIHQVSFNNMFFGESAGGGYALCDTQNSVAGPTLEHIELNNVRMEASDNNTSYGLINFSHSYVSNIYVRDVDIGVGGVQTLPTVNMGYFDQSYLDFTIGGGGLAAGVYAISGLGARADTFRNIPPSQINPNLRNINNAGGSSGNVVGWFDTSVGHLDSGGYESTPTQTTLNGTTAGNVIWAMPVHANYLRQVTLQFQGYENTTATGQVIGYPFGYNAAPATMGACPAGMNLSNGTQVVLPISMAAPFTGQCLISGW
jgi:hypothetical protein